MAGPAKIMTRLTVIEEKGRFFPLQSIEVRARAVNLGGRRISGCRSLAPVGAQS
jgi:hypothetical protein